VRAESAGAGGRRPISAEETLAVLGRAGLTPIPPYIRAARKAAGVEVGEETDRERYQTVYAASELSKAASVAAPTAGLHFAEGLLARLAAAGVGRADVTLHVGTGTFKPVEAEQVEDHPMHAESCSMGAGAVAAVRDARESGGRVVAVGTTSARTLETYAGAVAGGGEVPPAMTTRLLVTPGYEWKWVDGMLTNFHLPRSTLMAMVAALLPGGVARLKEVYGAAVKEGYRFYSYGDAMLVLP
jgi:S-adenosylmethionine:tRNA ribosyltransferase-isomerase